MRTRVRRGQAIAVLIAHPPLSRAGPSSEGNAAEQDSLQRLREHLTAEGAAVCLICLELLRREDPVWSCAQGCYDTVHLACIRVRRLHSQP